MASINPKFMSLCEEMYDNEEEDQERSEDYRRGGYHCVRIGDTFYHHRYRAIRKLGWGSFSTVWLCLDTKSNEYVAIKIVKSKQSIRSSALEEVQTLCDIQIADPSDPYSQRVVTVLNHFTISGDNGKHKCLVFEVLGESLYKFVTNSFTNGIPVEVLKRIVRQILEGLQYLHTKCDFIHTDIKPENILLTISKSKVKEMHSEVNRLIGFRDETQLPNSFVSTVLIEDRMRSDSLTDENQSNVNISGDKKSVTFDEDLSEISIKIADLGNACQLVYLPGY